MWFGVQFRIIYTLFWFCIVILFASYFIWKKMPFVDKDEPCVRAIHNCSKCNRRFTRRDSKESLIQHLQKSTKHQQISRSSVPESCGHCGRSFSGTRAFIQHLKNSRHHLKDLHHAACSGKFQLVDQLMRNEFANALGHSHVPSSKSQTGHTPMILLPLVMDKTLTPSPWTTPVDYLNGLP